MAFEFRNQISANSFNGDIEISIGDDAVGYVDLPTDYGFVSVIRSDTANAFFSAIAAYGSGRLSFIGAGSGSTVDMNNTTLTGTTGPGGDVSIAINSGQLAIENRTGPSRKFRVCFFGGG